MSLREVLVLVYGSDNKPIPGATVALYSLLPDPITPSPVQTTGADGTAAFFLDSAAVDVCLKVQGVPGYRFYLQGPNLLLPPRNVNVAVGGPGVGPTDIQLPPLALLAPPVNLRDMKANLCGVRVVGLPPVPGGASDPSLVLSWFLDRYSAADRSSIYATWKNRQLTHVVLSWPDSRSIGQSIGQFVATCQEVLVNGFAPVVFLTSKDYDSANSQTDASNLVTALQPVLSALLAVGVDVYSLGWELNLWLSPDNVAQLRDQLCPPITAGGGITYVHFSGGVFAWQYDGTPTAAFWNASVGKLTGILYQRQLSEDFPTYLARITDGLTRFAGNDGFVTDSGFGHPFDYVAFETSAQLQFNGQCTEAEGDAMGAQSMAVAPVTGPAGVTVGVIGFGNGSTT